MGGHPDQHPGDLRTLPDRIYKRVNPFWLSRRRAALVRASVLPLLSDEPHNSDPNH